MKKHIDALSGLVIAITFLLFSLALFFKGFTHDLLLEAGVFLVSVKLIIAAHKHSVFDDAVLRRLDEISAALRGMEKVDSATGPS
jgi:hypothetical protein